MLARSVKVSPIVSICSWIDGTVPIELSGTLFEWARDSSSVTATESDLLDGDG